MLKKKFPSGVVSGIVVSEIFQYAKENKFAIPAVNVSSSNTINSAMETAAYVNSPIIIQISIGGGTFYAGNSIKNNKISSIIGSKLIAIHIHELAKFYNATVILNTDHCYEENIYWIDGLIDINIDYYKNFKKSFFSSHMIDLSKKSLNENINLCKKYLKKISNMDMTLEIELGITGGEEDGVDNMNINKNKLYTNPKDVLYAYKELKKISSNFIIAAAFGNVHGVYRKGNIKLRPEILKESQKYIKNKLNIINNNPVNFVFHGGSGSSSEEIEKSIKYGVVKINIDTDLQYAFMKGVRDYIKNNHEFLEKQIGNSNNINEPNKKYYDPRIWLREGEISFKNYLKTIFEITNNINTLK